MGKHRDISDRVARLRALMAARLGGRTGSPLTRYGRHLPRNLQRDLQRIADAEPMLAHPELRLTQDTPQMRQRVARISAHVKGIDLVDQRKGWILGVLGGLVFNVLLMIALLVGIYLWRTKS
ncbi:MAG: hypothetical protein GDA36_09920 [Rhodobacteraceae bacterium]|nr:hypothetical protein [Paracoccaceae bacterium]